MKKTTIFLSIAMASGNIFGAAAKGITRLIPKGIYRGILLTATTQTLPKTNNPLSIIQPERLYSSSFHNNKNPNDPKKKYVASFFTLAGIGWAGSHYLKENQEEPDKWKEYHKKMMDVSQANKSLKSRLEDVLFYNPKENKVKRTINQIKKNIKEGAHPDTYAPQMMSDTEISLGDHPKGGSAIHVAAKYNNRELLHFLLKNNANPFIANDQGRSALHFGSLSTGIAEIFFQHNTKESLQQLKKHDVFGHYPVHNAVEELNVKFVRYLLNKGAHADQPDEKNKWTPLTYLVLISSYCNVGIKQEKLITLASLFLEKGANPNYVIPAGYYKNQSIKNLVEQNGNKELSELFKQYEK
jgi:hypothetical protein